MSINATDNICPREREARAQVPYNYVASFSLHSILVVARFYETASPLPIHRTPADDGGLRSGILLPPGGGSGDRAWDEWCGVRLR